MNIQDIADFIDLVKNPVKYEKVLQNIKDEQARLNAVIETVGKASELDKLRKEVEDKATKIKDEYEKKVEELDKSYSKKIKKVDSLTSDLELKIAQANSELEAAVVKQRSAEELSNSFAGRDKSLREQENHVATLREELKMAVSEYNEKIAKLRSVMV